MNTLTFGGNQIIIENGFAFSPEKEVLVELREVRLFLKDFVKRRVGENIKDGKSCHMWQDDTHFHIDCLSEPKAEFYKKWIQLNK